MGAGTRYRKEGKDKGTGKRIKRQKTENKIVKKNSSIMEIDEEEDRDTSDLTDIMDTDNDTTEEEEG